jgi:serine/threonine-protein kinase
MKGERWQKVEKLFQAAVELEPHEREAFLAAACGGDESLREQVEALLASDRDAGSFIDLPVFERAPELILEGITPSTRTQPESDKHGPQKPRHPEAEKRVDLDVVPPSGSAKRPAFVPGSIIAGRYRVVGLLGKGGMGEVYRADDLKLSHPVAIKFLSRDLTRDGAALARFHREVRTARQVSHPNVCRVYDIGEVDGSHFLSMEYIDGEDLASLIRRIGRLPSDKALEIARQLCAGLAAAHEAGVLHRDLKPANIMIDGRGKARITDFGLAVVTEELRGEESLIGTPAYMSPEQFSGKNLTVKSDIYALGLVLYELFTGKRAFEASSVREMKQLHESSIPPTPSSRVKEIDPLTERVIMRCLEKDPQMRPGSAIQVAAALPGGDPLMAALALGETPSPEMVAAAGEQGGLRPAVATALLGVFIAGVVLLVMLSQKVMLHNRVPLEKPPEVLTDRARTIIKKLGYDYPMVDSSFWFGTYVEYFQYLEVHDPSPNKLDRLSISPPAPVYFVYEQSPRYLLWYEGQVGIENPPLVSGTTKVTLDTSGRLLWLCVIPPQVDSTETQPRAADWSALFAEAGFDMDNFKAASPTRVPLYYADTRAAWEGVYPRHPDIPIRIEAAAYRGKPVYFEIVAPWDKPYRVVEYETPGIKIFLIIALIVVISFLITGLLIVRRNLRLGRGDRKGASRFAIFMFCTSFLSNLLLAHHVPTLLLGEPFIIMTSLMYSTLFAIVSWIVYIALEPIVRRRWPQVMISWSRVLSGGWRDPLVGRDILIGCVLTVVQLLLFYCERLLEDRGDTTLSDPSLWFNPQTLSGIRHMAGLLLMIQVLKTLQIMVILFLLFLVYVNLRKRWLGIGVVMLLLTTPGLLQGKTSLEQILFSILSTGLTMLVVLRFGMLPLIAGAVINTLFLNYPITTEFSAWYAGGTLFAITIALTLAGYGFYISLAGRELFPKVILTE